MWVSVGSIIGVVVILLVMSPFDATDARATKAVLLVLPVVGAAALGGRVPGYVAAAASTCGFALSLPPVGSIRISVAEDVVALVVFLLVAITVSTVVAARIDALAEVDRQRSLLLRSVSHDLRTPLTTILGASSELLCGIDHDEATTTRLLRLIDLEATRLERLVSNLLALNRIESGALEARPTALDVEDLLRHIVQRFSLGPSGVHVVLEVEGDLPAAIVDPDQIEVVIDNLLDNAVRHSPTGESVTLSAGRSGSGVQISVTDNGPGVSPSDAELIFQPFRSGSIAGSSGVGLAISRVFVDRNGGTISVDDHAGGGARFTVTLPSR